MKHRTLTPPALLVAAFVFLLLAGHAAASPLSAPAGCPALTAGVEDDSLRNVKALLQEHKRLRAALDTLRRQMDEFSEKIESLPPDTTGEINDELTRMDEEIRRIEDQLTGLGEELRDRMKDPDVSDAAPDVLRLWSDTTITGPHTGNIVASNGTLTITGLVDGDILAIDGAVILKPTAEVKGDIIGIHSTITTEDGSTVWGAVREEAAGYNDTFFSEEDTTDEDGGWTSFGLDDTEDEGRGFFRRFTESARADFPIGTGLAESFIRFNRVEGFYLGISDPKDLGWHSKPRLVTTFNLGYGFASHRWRYAAGMYLPLYLNQQIFELGFEGHSHTDSKDQWVIDRDENSAMNFFAREDFMDYFEREGFSAVGSWYSREVPDWNMKASLAYVHDTYRSLPKNTNWSLFGGDKVLRPNPVISDGNLNSFVLMLGADNAPATSSARHGWDARMTLETAGGMMAGDFDFRQIMVDIRRYQPLLSFLDMNLRVRGVASSGDVPLQRSFDIGGPSTLPGYRFKEFAGTHGALVNIEFILKSSIAHHSTGWFSSVMSGINLILFMDAGVTNNVPGFTYFDHLADLRSKQTVTFSDGFSDMKQWKSDVGFAIGNAGGAFRIGAAWRLDRPEKAQFILRLSRPF